MSIFYSLATPIGNLEDITLRALRVLKEVDLVLCEDTRQTKKLLDHYQINTPVLSYYQHSDTKKVNQILELIKEGKNLALVTDAGTPGISDPGNWLISHLVARLIGNNKKQLTNLPSNQVTIIPIPGPTALVTALSISGFKTDKFLFLGFLPKKKRNKVLQKIKESEYTIIFYESSHRIVKTLKDLELIIPERKIVLGRELTKKFETIYRGTVKEVLEQLLKGSAKGEFTIVIEEKER